MRNTCFGHNVHAKRNMHVLWPWRMCDGHHPPCMYCNPRHALRPQYTHDSIMTKKNYRRDTCNTTIDVLWPLRMYDDHNTVITAIACVRWTSYVYNDHMALVGPVWPQCIYCGHGMDDGFHSSTDHSLSTVDLRNVLWSSHM